MRRWQAIGIWACRAQLFAAAVLLSVAAPNAFAQRPLSLADSLRGDSAAFATLPATVLEVLDVRSRITPESADPNLVCVPLSRTSDGSKRQRLQGKLGDGTSLVVFARERTRGALGRVEFVRRLLTGEQRGYTWDMVGDATIATEWKAGETSATSYPIPRGGPIPRAVRSLGRLVMQWSCPAT
jgi:hypothetical protein